MADDGRGTHSILVVCTGNSARSQMGEALFAYHGGARLRVASAGTHPASRVHPLAVETLARHGIDWRDGTPKQLDEITGEAWDLVITVCDSAAEECPWVPGEARVHWGLPDPAAVTEPILATQAFEAAFTALRMRVEALLALPLETTPPADTAAAARRIHAESPA